MDWELVSQEVERNRFLALIMEVICGSLLAMLVAIPDLCGRNGRRHPPAAMLAAIECGLLTGARDTIDGCIAK